MYEAFVGIIVAIAGIITIVCSYFRGRLSSQSRQTNDNIRNTASRISDGVGEVNSTVKRIEDTTESVTRTSEELETSIGHSKSSIDEAQGTITNIRRLIKARRESIEENNLQQKSMEDWMPNIHRNMCSCTNYFSSQIEQGILTFFFFITHYMEHLKNGAPFFSVTNSL